MKLALILHRCCQRFIWQTKLTDGAATMKFDIPEGAQEAVEKLALSIAVAINSWSSGVDKGEEFERAVAMSALSNSLVMWSLLYEVPAEAVIKSVITTLHANGAFGDDDDETVH
jgi:hypothetical protein